MWYDDLENADAKRKGNRRECDRHWMPRSRVDTVTRLSAEQQKGLELSMSLWMRGMEGHEDDFPKKKRSDGRGKRSGLLYVPVEKPPFLSLSRGGGRPAPALPTGTGK